MTSASSLAALMFLELDGFLDFLGRDERAAVGLLSRYRDIVDPVIGRHGGELVDVTGSELLVSFSSAVAAVQCALEAVAATRVACSGVEGVLPRAGLHLGEIFRDEARVYGNGVNVAARVMQAAPGAALYLSEDVYRQVATKLDLRSREAPSLKLKNIERRLALFEIDTGAGFAAPEGFAHSGSGPAESPAAETAPAVPLPPGTSLPAAAPLAMPAPIPDGTPVLAREAPDLDYAEHKQKRLEGWLAKFEELDRLDKEGKLEGKEALKVLSGLAGFAKLASTGSNDAGTDTTITLTIGADSQGAESPIAESPGGKTPPGPEQALERLEERQPKRIGKLLSSFVVLGFLGYWAYTSQRPLAVIIAVAFGLFPFMGALNGLIRSGAERRRLEAIIRRASEREGA